MLKDFAKVDQGNLSGTIESDSSKCEKMDRGCTMGSFVRVGGAFHGQEELTRSQDSSASLQKLSIK